MGVAAAMGILAVLVATPSLAQNIDTTPAPMTNQNFSPFGVPNTATYGQTITIPAGSGSITSFGFEMNSVPATVVFRGHIYRWDPATSRAVGPSLYASPPRTTTGATKQIVTFTPAASVPVTAGQTYVIFASTSQDQAGAPAATGGWDGSTANVYAGGGAVFQNNGTDTTTWTGSVWSTPVFDFGFTTTFGAAVAPVSVPTMTEWALILFGAIMAGGAALYIQRRRLTA